MYNFLDRLSLQKVNLLHHIYKERRQFSSLELSQMMDLSERTILKIVDELAIDLEFITESAVIQKEELKYFQLIYKDNFSMKTVERYYLQNSLTYKAFDEMFYNKFFDINMFVLDNFTSPASVYRRIKKVKPLLDQFHLKYTSYAEISLEGTEKQLRYFYFLFYWNSCWGEEWPFTRVSREEILELMEEVDIAYSEQLLYWLAICLTRAKLGCLIEYHPMYANFTKHHHNYEQLSKKIKYIFREFTDLTDEEIELEIMFSFSIISCMRHYQKKDSAVSLLMNFAQHHNQELFVQATLYWMEIFMEHFSVTLDVEEYGALFVNLLHLHYFILTFSGPVNLFKDDLYKKRLEMHESAQIEIMNQFYDRLLENEAFAIVFKHKEILIGRYHKLLKQTIDFINRDTIKIKIYSMINDVPYLFSQIKRLFVHVELCSEDEEAELIITDRLYLNIYKDLEDIFVWNTVPQKGDYERLSIRLQEIYFTKYQQPNKLLLKTLLSEV
ncbi:helix-turn-helix domain-containing protein [Lysinibacillus sp. JNUCC 51]|uniref:helix-turn-helix domain-containing protein n=1 Tax=Lysinibacillus sp. JNUCC-51 TaxID=2792479 RepID=UPI001935DA8F|nr:helix-turn-helix domain-containing protein [Lysinibacillus sp. JNUCC-51]